MIEFNPYPVYSNNYCSGYTKYLAHRQAGKFYKFNPWFFFFNIFWLFRHKQFGMLALFALLISAFSFLMFGAKPEQHLMGIGTMTVAYYAFSCITYHMYHLKCLNQIDYNLSNPLEKMKPIPHFLAIPGAFALFLVFFGFFNYFQYYSMIIAKILL